MRLLSWNVNGIRAVHRKGDWDALWQTEKFDVLCLNETKAEEEQIPESVRHVSGYHSYFLSSSERKGHSGVAIYSKEKPVKVESGLGVKDLDGQGRLLRAYFKDFILIACYFPQGGGGEEKFNYKLDFNDAFLEHIEELRKVEKKPIIFCGDVNIAHQEIDLAHPRANKEHPGFRPEVREWLDQVTAIGWVDTFRHFYPDKTNIYSYWDVITRSRDRNIGWRIDYFFISPDLLPRLKKAEILNHIYGSDHCPVSIVLK